MITENTNLKKTPLYERHLALGARMVGFSGWEMPVQYTSILEEHNATRSKTTIFDICHMGEFLIKGDAAEKTVNNIFTADISEMKNNTAKYGFMLNDNAGIIDDLIVFKISSKEYMLVVNAGRIRVDYECIKSRVEPQAIICDESANTAKLDIQGPSSPLITAKIMNTPEIIKLKRFTFMSLVWRGINVIVSATGYTGEKGYEIFLPAENAVELWDAFLETKEVTPAGLGARDLLRLEMGYPLYGHDIDETHTPVAARLDKFVSMKKNFIGKDALLAQKNKGAEIILTGFICEGRRSPKEGFEIIIDNTSSGIVTSAGFSPCLKRAVGLCYIASNKAVKGANIIIKNNDLEINAVITTPPFIENYGLTPKKYNFPQ
ncbi:glycine cleavage system aminomethyltransferase T [Candidatus Omnitrophus magneticus]|uniref:aminomethyltransferase n=1 Tax=Candidatus Omnitrophus magneticus TaxID=1609969 RepID=A0A0F0CNZ4_9BACT|nr:glycine cleavage system aminomethyltransferase T [Candidatus Omnitrophus magneticus]